MSRSSLEAGIAFQPGQELANEISQLGLLFISEEMVGTLLPCASGTAEALLALG